MKTTIKILAYLSAALGTILFIRPRDRALNIFIWLPKLIAGALSPILGLAGALGALLGLFRKDWNLALAGLVGAGTAAKFVSEIPNGQDQFSAQFGPGWNVRQPVRTTGEIASQPNLIISQKLGNGKPLLADLWQPRAGFPRSGLGIIYSHGSGWRVGDKDLFTRPFFRQLVGQGHLVLDIAYTLYPEADIPTMVKEINQTIVWLKNNSQQLQVNPERIVLIGGSAGAHLSLLAAYAQGQPEFQPADDKHDTSVHGVVAFYPPVDFLELVAQAERRQTRTSRPVDQLSNAILSRLFELQHEISDQDKSSTTKLDESLVNLLGGTREEIPEVYDLLSPIKHLGRDCPPTLLIQGSDDVFDLTPSVRRLYQELQDAGVISILVEYPHTEHGFDLLLPQISPVARAATKEVTRFLDLMAKI